MDEPDLRELLRDHWALVPEQVVPLGGGMNSETWEVVSPGGRWALKAVAPRDSPGLEAGLRAALALEAGGIPAGAPTATSDGRLAVRLAEETVALLSWVDGRELDGDGADVGLIGTTLGLAHSILSATDISNPPSFDWIDVRAEHLDIEPWVRPAVCTVLDEWSAVRPSVTTWSYIHGDPAPAAFIESRDGGPCGIIDWAGGMFGPCLYDLASAAMYLGPDAAPELVAAYQQHGPVTDEEIQEGLPTLLRLRFAVQADYFARRVHENDLTGITDESGNSKGLADARRLLGV